MTFTMPAPFSTIKVGILGCASIARRSLIPAFVSHSAFECTVIASRDKRKAEEVAKSFGCVAMTYDELISSDVDLIYVPLPNSLHFEWVLKCLNAGKHVLCEKSLGCNLEEVESMVTLAREKNRFLMESFQWRFHSQTQTVKDIVSSGVLGEIRSFRSSFGFPPFPNRDNIRYNKELGGGALLDAGAYTVKATTELLGYDFQVKAATLRFDPDLGVDLGGSLYMERSDGLVSETAFGFDNFYQCNYELWGAKGKLTVKRAFTAPPGFEPEIVIETADGVEARKFPADDHFSKMLDYVFDSISSNQNTRFESERKACIVQSRLLAQAWRIGNGR